MQRLGHHGNFELAMSLSLSADRIPELVLCHTQLQLLTKEKRFIFSPNKEVLKSIKCYFHSLALVQVPRRSDHAPHKTTSKSRTQTHLTKIRNYALHYHTSRLTAELKQKSAHLVAAVITNSCVHLEDTGNGVGTELEGYKLYKTLRSANRNDGVLVYVRECVCGVSVQEAELGGVHSLLCDFTYNNKQFNLLAVYGTHDNNLDDFTAALNEHYSHLTKTKTGPPVVDDNDHTINMEFVIHTLTETELHRYVTRTRGGSAPGYDCISASHSHRDRTSPIRY
ncbi:hypothetical protein J6590_084937 [Homalodisca vitripennis]|nr:hypothetical protein J6590_084937 [Homalodisca vitripennis]